MSRLSIAAPVLALIAIPFLLAASGSARAWGHHGDRGLDHAISVAKDRAQAAREKLADARAHDRDDIARDRARFDRAEDHVDHLQKEDRERDHK